MPLAVDFEGGITDAWSNVAAFVPKLVAALLILLVGYFVAKAVSSILNKVLERVGFDRVVERGGVRQVLARSKYDASDILAKLVFWTVMLFVLQLAFGVFGPNPVSDLLRGLIAYLPNVFVAILIVVIAAAIARALTDLLSNLLGAVQGGQLIARGAGVAVLVFAVFAALDQLQIAPRIVTGLWYAILAAVVGSVIVAVGGGGIRTMQRYWERTAGRAEERGPELREQVRASARSAQPDPPGAYERTQTYQPSGGAYAADDATDDLGDGRTRRNL
jgi:mechanosensitive ion channel-like protein